MRSTFSRFVRFFLSAPCLIFNYYVLRSANKSHVTYLPDFNRFILEVAVGYTANQDCGAAGSIFDLGPYPWGKPVIIGSFERDPQYSGLCTDFPNLILATYQKISDNPLMATIKGVVSGGSFFSNRQDQRDNYSPHLRTFWLSANAPATMTRFTSTGVNGTHISNGLLAFWDMVGPVGVKTIPDLAAGTYTYTAPDDTHLPMFDKYGFISMQVVSGGVDQTGDGISWDTTWRHSLTTTFPLTKALNDFTMFVPFCHCPYQDDPTGTVVNDGLYGETILAKTGGDVSIVRHGSTFGSGATWDVTVHGTTLNGSVPCADGTWCLFTIRSNGTTATAFTRVSASPTGNASLTPDASGTVRRAGSSGSLILGGMTSLQGIISSTSIYNRALTDVEIKREAEVFWTELSKRGER